MLSSVYAQLPNWDNLEDAYGGQYTFQDKPTFGTIFNVGLINIIFFIAGAAFLLFLISSGLSMMTSRGDPKALAAAKAKLTSALIGFIIIFTAYWIVQVVGLLLGLPGFGGVFV